MLEKYEIPYPNHGYVILADPSPIFFLYLISCKEVHCLVDILGKKVPSSASGEMEKYFSKKNWYNPYLKDVSNYLTDIETKNILTIARLEQL